MKTLVLILSLTLSFASQLLANPPAVNGFEAAKIAQSDLEERGIQNKVYIEQIILKKEGLLKDETYWEIMWNDEFPAQTPGRKEYGLRVFMDGSYKRAVR